MIFKSFHSFYFHFTQHSTFQQRLPSKPLRGHLILRNVKLPRINPDLKAPSTEGGADPKKQQSADTSTEAT